MNSAQRSDLLVHPEHGEIPARRLLECVFALTPAGRILHFHLEQTDVIGNDLAVRYTLNGAQPKPERARCQMIPPFVTAFQSR
ncbi:MAG: hypothetical protein EXR86_14635 [Gammaproteobacteria bacterium]|nr:hypothetical protein [Gammaproteobacteria bacterium]